MRSEKEVQDRIRFLLSSALSRKVLEACTRMPCNCQHNHSQALDTRKNVAGEPNANYNRVSGEDLPVIGLCLLGVKDPVQWEGTICEDPIDAQRCSSFSLVSTRETISAEFDRQIKDLGWVEKHLPEVYGLLWALGSEVMPKLPWWKVLWFRFVQIRPDRLVKTVPSTLLLED